MTCALLKRMSVAKEVVVWEKSRGVGGRMSSSGTRTGDCVVDLGAQYVTATQDYVTKHGKFYEELTAAGVLKEMEAVKIDGERHKSGDTNFVAPAGMASIAKHFIEKSGASVEFGRRARSVERNDDGTAWTVTDEVNYYILKGSNINLCWRYFILRYFLRRVPHPVSTL